VGGPLFWAVARLDLHLPGARSLKEKRHDLRPLVERLRNRFMVLVLETDHQDLHQRATIVVAALASESGAARGTVQRALDHVHQTFPGVVLGEKVALEQWAWED
jgi:hypothetical protein